ncbi:MAG: NAD(P)H-quinone oxidoreductase subunit L [Phormidesmis priestleyi Ana]|uniref:NAD(P)H-quinone oxidoreductase subunit L n=1 Tax=Phormidesmis priestleyi Ana TaxID=1666911 RepID=A0A0P7ZM83_9CYAN|nr:MAG: NAD(P)H-quinone oxidoreductase subunit L [Phormidesmis priestleyi Ana]
MNFPVIESSTLVTLAAYAVLGGLYLVVIPLALMFYTKARFYEASSIERLGLYGLILVFFPGMLLLSPFLNFRPKRREV